ncbi:PRC-barrel domain-containing protein [Dinoroseobacter sp. S375]|uniref:PRC-barrel domain-containing protein n=1 Tax=Dinoroseobacter sp. S375 TaxID=3415136 RepID=UPI003C7D4A66
MNPIKTGFLMGASAAALMAASQLAYAQTTPTTEDGAVANVAGGQVVVEQEDATVDVTIPEPSVEVTQGQPIVTVEQAQPEIVVTVPQPTVSVEQQAPIITIEQAQPQVTVRIPEPTVTVQLPEPQVDVATGEPTIAVDQPEPIIRFVRPEPKITVEEAEPNIRVTRADPQVNVQRAGEAQVDVSQAEANVRVEQSDDADIQVSAAAEPEVNIVPSEGADIEIEQAQARVVMEEFGEDGRGVMSEPNRERYRSAVRDLPLFNMTVDDLIGRSVATESGEDVGEVDFIGKRGDKLVAIIGVGGFLGMGENEVAVPVQKLIMRRDELIVPQVTQAQLERMPEFNEAEVDLLDPGVRLAEAIGLD